jgi:hypothetical protein
MQGPDVFTVGVFNQRECAWLGPAARTVGASVELFRLVLANGPVERCSREEHSVFENGAAGEAAKRAFCKQQQTSILFRERRTSLEKLRALRRFLAVGFL